ncbi:MAG: ATP-binding protein [Methylobacter sp.]
MLNQDQNLTAQQLNLSELHAELDWLAQVIDQVIRSYLKQDGHEAHWSDIPLPDLNDKTSVYAKLVRDWSLDSPERLALALTMAPHLRPHMLDVFFSLNAGSNRGFSEFGGIADKNFSGFLPTGQTLSFLISANDPLWHTSATAILDPGSRLMREQVLLLGANDDSLPTISGALSLSNQWLHYFLTGEKVRPELSSSFPAHPIDTPLEWSDLVLEYPVMLQVQEIKTWLNHGDTLMHDWGLAKKIKPGYRALFFGPPGTGKTLTASLLAKSTGREIYRVDLSMIVSKYIGETEKNLSKVFDVAAYKDWILFFDEADALFGQRTEASNSNDRHANQQTGYLLQRIEDFPGVVVLATNLKANMDDAFTRRFQAMIHFTMPKAEERLLLWQNAFHGSCELDDDVDLEKIAEDYELAGGAIINVLRYCALSAIGRGSRRVSKDELLAGIRREFRKDNKTI